MPAGRSMHQHLGHHCDKTLILNPTKLYPVCSFTKSTIDEIPGKQHSGDAQAMLYCRAVYPKDRGHWSKKLRMLLDQPTIRSQLMAESKLMISLSTCSNMLLLGRWQLSHLGQSLFSHRPACTTAQHYFTKQLDSLK